MTKTKKPSIFQRHGESIYWLATVVLIALAWVGVGLSLAENKSPSAWIGGGVIGGAVLGLMAIRAGEVARRRRQW